MVQSEVSCAPAANYLVSTLPLGRLGLAITSGSPPKMSWVVPALGRAGVALLRTRIGGEAACN